MKIKTYCTLVAYTCCLFTGNSAFGSAGFTYGATADSPTVLGIKNAATTTVNTTSGSSTYQFTFDITGTPSGVQGNCCAGYPCTGTTCSSPIPYGGNQYVSVTNTAEGDGYYVITYNAMLEGAYEGTFSVKFSGTTPTITGTPSGGTASIGTMNSDSSFNVYFTPNAPTILGVSNATSNDFYYNGSSSDLISSCCTGNTASCVNSPCSSTLAPGDTQYVNLSNTGYLTVNYTTCNQGSLGAQFGTSGGVPSFTAESYYNGTATAGTPTNGVYPLSFATASPPPCYSSSFPTPQTYGTGTTYRGFNLAGCDFETFSPPCACDAIYFMNQGANVMRLPVLWEFLQPNLNTVIDFTTGYAGIYAQIVSTLTNAGVKVIIDMHNYMRYNISSPGSVITGPNYIIGMNYPDGSSYVAGPTVTQYASAWGQIATYFATNTNVIFDLMNEPNDMSTQLILDNYNAAIAQVRYAEQLAGVDPHLILLEGNGFSCLGAWVNPNSDYGGQCNASNTGSPSTGCAECGTGSCNACVLSNASVFTPSNIVDTGNNYAINVHNYFTGQLLTSTSPCEALTCCGSGTIACIDAASVLTANNFSDFVAYLQTNNLRAFLTELGGVGDQNTYTLSEAQNCAACITNMLTAVEGAAYNGDYGFIGWTGWSGGSFQSTYDLSLNPISYTDGIPNQPIQMTSGFNNFMTPL